jgi:hypothetical protein
MFIDSETYIDLAGTDRHSDFYGRFRRVFGKEMVNQGDIVTLTIERRRRLARRVFTLVRGIRNLDVSQEQLKSDITKNRAAFRKLRKVRKQVKTILQEVDTLYVVAQSLLGVTATSNSEGEITYQVKETSIIEDLTVFDDIRAASESLTAALTYLKWWHVIFLRDIPSRLRRKEERNEEEELVNEIPELQEQTAATAGPRNLEYELWHKMETLLRQELPGNWTVEAKFELIAAAHVVVFGDYDLSDEKHRASLINRIRTEIYTPYQPQS